MFFDEYRNFYNTIGSVRCPYFANEMVLFNRKGFNHLLRKGRNQRPVDDWIERLPLLKFCQKILSGEYTFVEHRISIKGDKVAQFWGFTAFLENKEMRLIVKQLGEGQKHFFGIFPIKH